MGEERRLRGDGIVTYVVSKTLAVVASTLLLLLGWHVVDLRRILLSSTLCLAALVAHLVTQTQLSESITLIKQLGVQIESKTLLVSSRTFVEKPVVVLLNEAITSSEVYYYLCFVREGEKDVAVAFPTSRPSSNFLIQAYKESKN